MKLDTSEGLLEGHGACTKYLENTVADLHLQPAMLDTVAQRVLPEEIEPVFTASDNEMICALPDKDEV